MTRFITFEGIEGSGKSTQLERAAEFLASRGLRPVVTREPGGTRIGDEVRGVLLNTRHAGMAGMTELLLVYAARVQHLKEVIGPALEQGLVVLCDRYEDSTLAYQGFGRGIPQAEIRKLSAMTTGGVAPGLTFLLDLPVEEGLERALGRNTSEDVSEARMDQEAATFHRKVRDGFLTLAREQPGRFRVLNASRPPEEVASQVAAELTMFLKLT
jgi:dTMP kinase